MGTAGTSLAAALEGWEQRSLEEKIALRAALRRVEWRFQARNEQLPPEQDWQTAYLSGGRGSGKSWTASNWFAEEIQADPLREQEGPGRWAIVAPTFADARDKCIESDESGLLRALGTNVREIESGTSASVEKWNRSIGELHLKDGSIVHIDGADDGAYRIQGFSLRGVWADEIGLWKKWQTAWDESIAFALRKGRSRIIATGTPKRSLPARRLVKRLLADHTVLKRRFSTADNWGNLSAAFRAAVQRFIGTTLGAQELEGRLLENAEGALWQLDWIEKGRVSAAPAGGWQSQPVIGVDPSDGTDDGAAHAYTACALAMDNDLYVIEQEALRGSPTSFARHVVLRAAELSARIVVEKNHGGQWLVAVFKRAMTDLGVHVTLKVVSASQGKLTRAEPIAALYEPRRIQTPEGKVTVPGRVRHVGYFDALEDQMCIAGDSLVVCKRGEIPVRDVVEGDDVWTRSGWRPVTWSGTTGVRETLKIETDSGSLCCTPDHPVFVEGRGFVRADLIRAGERIPTCQSHQFVPVSSLTASASTATTTGTTRRADHGDGGFSTARSGQTHTGRSHQGSTSITSTATARTTRSKTFRRSARKTMRRLTRFVGSHRPPSLSAVVSGNANGQHASHARTSADNVARSSTRRACASPTTARPPAASAVVHRVLGSGRKPVYNLTVADAHEFFANGLLTHNCNFTGAAGEASPDELDSLVWALSEFTSHSFKPSQGVETVVPYRDGTQPVADFVEQVRSDPGLPPQVVAWR